MNMFENLFRESHNKRVVESKTQGIEPVSPNVYSATSSLIQENKALSSEEATKEYISKRLSELTDKVFSNVLREIIFQSNVDWKDVQRVLVKHEPEVVLESSDSSTKRVSIAFDAEVPSDYTVNNLEEAIRQALEKKAILIDSVVEIHDVD